jgi:hypothetical protein
LCELFLLEQTLMLEGAGWLRACLEHAGDLTDAMRVRAGICFGRIQGRVRPDAWIGVVIEDSLAIARSLGDERAVARAIIVRSEQAWRDGNLAAGQADAREGLARACAAGDPVAESWGYFVLGWILGSAGEHAGAHTAFERGLAICRRIGYGHATADMLLGLAEVAFLRGSIMEAQTHTRARLEVEQQLQNALGIASCHEASGVLASSRQDDLGTIEQLSQALEYYDTCSSPFAVQVCAWLSMAAALQGDLSQAAHYGRTAFEGMRRAHEPVSTLTSRERDVAGLAAAAAALALARGRPDISIRLCAALEHAGVEQSTLMNASPADRPFRERIATLARERLADSQGSEQLCAVAQHLTLDQIEHEAWHVYASGE